MLVLPVAGEISYIDWNSAAPVRRDPEVKRPAGWMTVFSDTKEQNRVTGRADRSQSLRRMSEEK